MKAVETTDPGAIAADEQTRPGLAAALLAFASVNRTPLIAFAVHLVLVFSVTAIAMHEFYALTEVPAIQYALPPMTGIAHYTIQPLRNWDGFWYSLIASYGYGVYDASAAFWPLYPLLLRLGSQLTEWSIPTVGVLISNAAFLVALVILYWLVRLDYSEGIARRTVWLTTLFPTAFFFSAVYTEALFLLVTVAAIYFARTDRWGRAAVFTALAALTRNTGVLVLIPIGIMLVKRYGWNPRRWWINALQVGTAALSPIVFFLHLDQVWHEPLLPLKAQKGWARYQAMPWTTIRDAFDKLDLTWLHALYHSPTWATLTDPNIRLLFAEHQSYDVFILLAFVPIIAYTLLRVRGAYSLYALPIFMLPLFSPSLVHPLMSIPRFVIVLFPFFIAMAMLTRNRWIYLGVLALFVVQFVGLLIQFSTWYWVA
jgi:hypothetical protein